MLIPRHGLHRLAVSILCIKLLFIASAPTHANCLEKLAKETSSSKSLIKPGAKFLLSLGVFSGVLYGVVSAWAKVTEYDAQINALSYKIPETNYSFQCHPDCYYAGNCNGFCLETMSNFSACQAYIDRCLSLTNPRGLWVLGAVVGTLVEIPILYSVLYYGMALSNEYHYQADCNQRSKQRFQHLKGLCQPEQDMAVKLNNLKEFYLKFRTEHSSSKLTVLDVYLYLQKGTETDELCPHSSIMEESQIIAWLDEQKPLKNDADYKTFVQAMEHSDEAYNLVAFHDRNNVKVQKMLKKPVTGKQKNNKKTSTDPYAQFIRTLENSDEIEGFEATKSNYQKKFGQKPNVAIPMGHDSENDC